MPRRPALRALAAALAATLLAAGLLPLVATAQESQPAARRGEEDDVPGMTWREWRGDSVLRLAGACVAPRPCVGENRTGQGSFFLGAGGSDARIVVSWVPADKSLRTLRVVVGESRAEGESPLELRIASLPPGEHAVRVEPAGRVLGAFDQRVEWTVAALVAVAPDPAVTLGTSAFLLPPACLLARGCDAATSQRAGAFLAPWPASGGSLDLEWEAESPLTEELVVEIPGTGVRVVGESPLHVDLPALAPGEYEVRVLPAATGAPTALEQTVAWRAQVRQA